MMPIRYGLDWLGFPYSVHLSVYQFDGTVAIAHGGVEVGQGINTKVGDQGMLRVDYVTSEIFLSCLFGSWLVEFIKKFLQFQPEVQQQFFNCRRFDYSVESSKQEVYKTLEWLD